MTTTSQATTTWRPFLNWRWSAALLLLLVIVSYLLFQTLLSIFVDNADHQRHAGLREKVLLARNALEPILREVRSGVLSKVQAVERSQALLNNMTYEDECGPNYIFLNTTDGTVLVRPFRPQDVGRNMFDIKDSQGKYYMRELPATARANPDGGFCSYLFPHPGTGQEEEKLSYVMLIPELDAVLGTGAYMSRITQAKIALMRRAFAIGFCLLILLGLPLVLALRRVQQQNLILQQEIEQRHATEEQLVRNEERARQQEAMFRTLFETNPSSITIHRASDSRYIMANPAFQHQTGLALDRILGHTNDELGIRIDAESVNAMQNHLQANGRVDHVLAQVTFPNGRSVFNLFSFRPIQLEGEACVLSVALDVTEVKRLQEQMHQVQKLDAIGQLAGGVAHDFNNMLTGILGSAECLSMELDEQQSGREYLDMIIEAARRAAELTRNLLTFARKNRLEMSEVNVHTVITSSVKLLQRTLNKNVKIETALDSKQQNIQGDASQLMNALINLGINAGHAMPDGGTLKFSTREAVLDDVFCQASSFDLNPGSYIVIAVEDSGTGISPENLPHIFEPFFTTKDKEKGTGLGLAAVYGTICQHHGAITVYSEPGNGTIFHVYLPSSGSTHAEDVDRKGLEAVTFRGSGRILVVDDEASVRRMSELFLRNIGFEVTTAENGREALELFKADPSGFTLVLLDMIMPEMDGRTCFFELKKLNAQAKIIVSSGFSHLQDLQELQAAGLRTFLRKPFHLVELSRAIARELQPPEASS